MAVCVGSCFEVVDGILQLQIDPAGGLTCGTDGLAADFPAILDPISPDACNGIARRGNGLYAPCPDAIAFVAQTAPGPITPFDMTFVGPGAATFDFPSDVVTITNTTCCDVAGRISCRAGGVYVTTHNGFVSQGWLEINIAGAGYGAAFPDSVIVLDNPFGVDHLMHVGPFHDENYLSLAAGASVTYQCRIHVTVDAGSAACHGAFGSEINWILAQTGCC